MGMLQEAHGAGFLERVVDRFDGGAAVRGVIQPPHYLLDPERGRLGYARHVVYDLAHGGYANSCLAGDVFYSYRHRDPSSAI